MWAVRMTEMILSNTIKMTEMIRCNTMLFKQWTNMIIFQWLALVLSPSQWALSVTAVSLCWRTVCSSHPVIFWLSFSSISCLCQFAICKKADLLKNCIYLLLSVVKEKASSFKLFCFVVFGRTLLVSIALLYRLYSLLRAVITGTLCSVMMSMLLSLPQPARWSTYNVTLIAQGTGIISTVNGTEHITASSAEFRESFDCTSHLLSVGAVSAELL